MLSNCRSTKRTERAQKSRYNFFNKDNKISTCYESWAMSRDVIKEGNMKKAYVPVESGGNEQAVKEQK